jgi:hypothetical protein
MYDFMGKCVEKYLLYAESIYGHKTNMIMDSILQNLWLKHEFIEEIGHNTMNKWL